MTVDLFLRLSYFRICYTAKHPFTFSYVFFLLFIFLIVVVLMNLLNGLAVSDTGLIREEVSLLCEKMTYIEIFSFQAEIHAHVSRVEVIAHVEATLLGDPAHLLRGYGWFGKLIPTCGLRRRIGSALKCRAVFRTLTGSIQDPALRALFRLKSRGCRTLPVKTGST